MSCSVTGKLVNGTAKMSSNLLDEDVLKSIENQNITRNNFFIQKAEIEVINQEKKEKFISNIKFEYPDRYLVSIKSKSGIEGLRIYICEDTILANDRIRRKIYVGTSFYFMNKYGLSKNFLPLIVGDIILEKSKEIGKEKCAGDELNIDQSIGGILLNYSIDCNKRKISHVEQVNNSNREGIKIKYGNFFKKDSILVPHLIEFYDAQSNTKIRIKVVRIELRWNGKVEFVPGKGYELIELL
jgi:hypothetical protein